MIFLLFLMIDVPLIIIGGIPSSTIGSGLDSSSNLSCSAGQGKHCA